MAGNLADVIEIFRLAKENNVPCWSSSSLRFQPGVINMRKTDKFGEVLGCDTHAPCAVESYIPDLYWYGVHGVEILADGLVHAWALVMLLGKRNR